jgi:hypothetical protein
VLPSLNKISPTIQKYIYKDSTGGEKKAYAMLVQYPMLKDFFVQTFIEKS